MAGMSLLRPSVIQGVRLALLNSKAVSNQLQKQFQLQGQLSVRNAGHEKRMQIVPSTFEWSRFKDDAHFYIFLGLLPIAALITYVNIVVGPAELSDIPEGYEPKEWEYHRSPIKRWFAKYVYEEPQKSYEMTLHWIHYWSEKKYWNALERKVMRLAEDRLDYKGWYWVNGDKSVVDSQKANKEERNRYIGT